MVFRFSNHTRAQVVLCRGFDSIVCGIDRTLVALTSQGRCCSYAEKDCNEREDSFWRFLGLICNRR